MNERSNTFICPICNSRIKWENIILDEYFEEILKMAANQDDIDTIEIHPDGSWSLPGTETLKGSDIIKKEAPSLQDEDIMIIDSDDEHRPQNAGYHLPKPSMTPVLPIPALLNYNSTDGVPSLPFVQATHVEQNNLLAYDPPAQTSTFISQSREENMAPDENVIDLTLSSDDEDTPIGTTFGRNLAVNVSNIFNQNPSNQIQPTEHQDISENNRQTVDASGYQPQRVLWGQEGQIEPDNSNAEAMEKALDEALVQLDVPAVVQPKELDVNANAIATELPQILETDVESHLRASSRPIDPSPSHPIESECSPTVQDMLIFERGKNLDISSFTMMPSPALMERSPQRDRNVDDRSASAVIDPVPNLIQRSPQSRIDDNVTFEDKEVDELLSSIPDPIFPRNSEESSPNPQQKSSKKSNSRKKQQVIYSSSIDVSIPSSQNDESDEDLDKILSSIPDQMLGNFDKDAGTCNSRTEEHTNYSLDVIVGNQGESEDHISHPPASSRTEDCVLTPSPIYSEDDNYESLTGKVQSSKYSKRE
jgi:hypothetical protein